MSTVVRNAVALTRPGETLQSNQRQRAKKQPDPMGRKNEQLAFGLGVTLWFDKTADRTTCLGSCYKGNKPVSCRQKGVLSRPSCSVWVPSVKEALPAMARGGEGTVRNFHTAGSSSKSRVQLNLEMRSLLESRIDLLTLHVYYHPVCRLANSTSRNHSRSGSINGDYGSSSR